MRIGFIGIGNMGEPMAAHIARELGQAMAVEAPLTALVSERWASARDAVGPGRDNTEAYIAWSAKPPKVT